MTSQDILIPPFGPVNGSMLPLMKGQRACKLPIEERDEFNRMNIRRADFIAIG
jgi:hypothetical protein